MVEVTQQVCACDPCVCIVNIDSAVEHNGQHYCSENCADGHANEAGCGHKGCGC